SRGSEGLCVRAMGLMFIHIVAKNGFTQTPRAAVHQHNQLMLAQAEELECPCIKHLINQLQLRKMVATNQSLVEFRGSSSDAARTSCTLHSHGCSRSKRRSA